MARSKPRNADLPTTTAARQALLRSKKRGVVRTATDWEKLLESPGNPLAGVPKKAVARFTKTLVFKRNGLGHANYGEIQDNLTYRQFSALWGAFGLSMSLFEDYKDYYCKATGTCSKSITDICTSNC